MCATGVDGCHGNVAVNNSAEKLAGWHGGPTNSESLVPMMFGMPGNNFVNDNGQKYLQEPNLQDGYLQAMQAPRVVGNTGNPEDGYLRNWHLSYFVTEILKQYREDIE